MPRRPKSWVGPMADRNREPGVRRSARPTGGSTRATTASPAGKPTTGAPSHPATAARKQATPKDGSTRAASHPATAERVHAHG